VAQNPFLLTLLCAVAEQEELPHDIPRTHLYDRALRLTLGGQRRADHWLPLLRELAWVLFMRAPRQPRMDGGELLTFLRDSDNRPPLLQPAGDLSALERAALLRDELCQARLLVPLPSPGGWVFPHRSFAEFLAASHLADLVRRKGWQAAVPPGPPGAPSLEAVDLVDRKAWDPAWEQVILFLAGKLAEPRPLLELLSNETRDDVFRHRLGLAGQCLGELRQADRDRLGPLVDAITTGLVSLWVWHEDHFTGTAALHLARALPALGQTDGRVLATPLLEEVRNRGSVGYFYHSPPVLRSFEFEEGGRLLDWLGRLLVEGGLQPPFWAFSAARVIGVRAVPPTFLHYLAGQLAGGEARAREEAVRMVQGIGGPAATAEILAALVPLLVEPAGGVRETAEQALRSLGRTAARVDFLGEVATPIAAGGQVGQPVEAAQAGWGACSMRREDKLLQAAAIKAATLVGAPVGAASLERLGELLGDEEPPVRAAAAETVGRLPTAGAGLRDRLGELLRDGQPEVRAAAAEAVGRLGSDAAQKSWLDDLAGLLRDPDREVRATAVEAVGGLGSAAVTDEILDRLAELLQAGEGPVRATAARAVANLGSGEARAGFSERLVEMLRDSDGEARAAAATALGALGPAAARPEVLSGLAGLLRDDKEPVRAAAERALAGIGSAAVGREFLDGLVKLLGDADASVRAMAARALGGLGRGAVDDHVLNGLARLLNDTEALVQDAAAAALGALGSAAARDDILRGLAGLLRHPAAWVAQTAAEALGALGSAAARPDILDRLAALLDDGDDEVRKLAAEAVASLGAAAGRPDILDRLAALLGDASKVVRYAAVKAVGALGTAAARPGLPDRLAALLEDEGAFTELWDRIGFREQVGKALARLMGQGVRYFETDGGAWAVWMVAELSE
jgi:HEAT repeat protein